MAERGWPLLVLAAIGIVVGYGPSVWWCWFASRRWGSGHLAHDVGLRFSWSDAGWGPPLVDAFGCELAVLLVVQLAGIPLVGNTEGIGNVDADRAYVIALLLTAVVATPFVEELVFRGLMLRGLLSRIAVVPAVAVQALLFGVAHIDPVRGSGNIGLALVLGAVGVALGGATYCSAASARRSSATPSSTGSCWRSSCSSIRDRRSLARPRSHRTHLVAAVHIEHVLHHTAARVRAAEVVSTTVSEGATARPKRPAVWR